MVWGAVGGTAGWSQTHFNLPEQTPVCGRRLPTGRDGGWVYVRCCFPGEYNSSLPTCSQHSQDGPRARFALGRE